HPATTEFYTLSLHDALPIWTLWSSTASGPRYAWGRVRGGVPRVRARRCGPWRRVLPPRVRPSRRPRRRFRPGTAASAGGRRRFRHGRSFRSEERRVGIERRTE